MGITVTEYYSLGDFLRPQASAAALRQRFG